MKRLPLPAVLLLLLAGVWMTKTRKGVITSQSAGEVLLVAEQANARPDRTGPQTGASQVAKALRQIDTSTKPRQVARGIPITPEFVRNLATGPRKISFKLPDGRWAEGSIDQRHTAADGSPAGVSGRLVAPGAGTFHFRVQPAGASSGPVVGAVVMDEAEIAFGVLPGAGMTSVLTARPVDQVICRSYTLPPENADGPQEIPADHPTNIPYPSYQNGVIPLQSRPGAVAVVYLDFDGEAGPHEGWQGPNGSEFDAAPPTGISSNQIKAIWQRVAEDFTPFNLNVTTDLQAFLDAPETSRQRCIITPTTTASPGAGGVAYVGSFGWSGDTPCWCFFYFDAKNATEIISHEIGHTLGLWHDGRSPSEEYYRGHGSFSDGWTPIMGVGYYRNLSQWSKGEYSAANQQQDDVAIIANNEGVGFVDDDAGDTHANAATLEVFAGGAVDAQGNIEMQSDVDAFRFTTTGGTVSLTIDSVPTGANLDILASLHESNGDLIVSNNPNSNLDATLLTTLPAGEYTVRVDGAGRGDPLGDGYTDYGSLGQYTITGIISGAVGPDRFTLAENSPFGSVVGTAPPRNDHGGSPLVYGISSGNTDSAFAIDPVTGTITVANSPVLDFEALSTSWDHPPFFELTVTISNAVTPALDESLRVIVGITDINEAPGISSGTSIVAISHTLSGVTLGQLTAYDPDRFDFATVEIIAGDPSGTFSLSPSGSLTLTGVLDASVQANHSLTVRTTDHGSPPVSTDQAVTVTVIPAAPEFTPGVANQTFYDDVYGWSIADLTEDSSFPTRPSREIALSTFSTSKRGDSYGSTVRAWLIAPVTGNYQFWIAGDDAAELYLATNGIPASMTKICGLTSFTGPNQWTQHESQQSATYSLTAGQVCYIEARHKQDLGENHLSVAWEIEDPPGAQTLVSRQVIPGRYLSPHSLNYSPEVLPFAVNLYRNSYAGYQVANAFTTDPNPADSHTWTITAGNEAGAFVIDSATGKVTVANVAALEALAASPVILTLTASDNGTAPLSDSGPLTIHLLDVLDTPTVGLVQEFWDDIPGIALADLYADSRYPDRPDRLVDLNSFVSEMSLDSDSGARIRAYFVPPFNDSYTFSIAYENTGSLFLSSDSSPANAIQIASSDSLQASLPIPLSAGQRYFIEVRVKNGSGDNQFSVFWSRTGDNQIQVIGDAESEPYDSNIAPVFPATTYDFNLAGNYIPGTVVGTVNATDSPFEAIRYSILSGNPLNTFAIDPETGTITVMNPANLTAGAAYQLQVGAQDSGHGRHFAPRETLVPVTISIPNEAPVFAASPVNLGGYPAGLPISQSLAPYVTDPEDTVAFALVSGPSWVSLSPSGVLSGAPAYSDFGPHLLAVTADDGQGHTVPGTVSLTVSAPSDIPASILTTSDAFGVEITGSLDALTTLNSSTSDNSYETLTEASADDSSALEYRWIFATTPNRLTALRIEAHHTANIEDDDFQFSVSTDGGETFTAAILVTNTTDDDTPQVFSFAAGPGETTMVKVVDTNRTAGNSELDTLSIDLLTLTLAANTVPSGDDATFQVASHAPVGVAIGSAAATDPDPEQTLSYSIPRGNEAGLFSINRNGTLKVAADIPPESGPFTLIVVSTDNGTPALANYATITVNIVPPITATITVGNLTQAYDGTPKSVTVTTSPPNLNHALTYGTSSVAPSDFGEYTVTATITDPIYTGTTTDVFSITNLLTVTSEQTFIAPETTIPYQSLQNDGTLIVATGLLQVTGNATTTGILRLYGDAVIDITGTFTNSGVIDIINWNGTLPPALINTGTIIDRSALRIITAGTSETQFTLSVPSFAGHIYQLETSSLADPWSPLGPPVPGNGNALNPPLLQFTPDLDGPARFYRIAVTPAP